VQQAHRFHPPLSGGESRGSESVRHSEKSGWLRSWWIFHALRRHSADAPRGMRRALNASRLQRAAASPRDPRQLHRTSARTAEQKLARGRIIMLKTISLGLSLTMLVATAALAQKVRTESAPGANFGAYKTYMWIKQPNVSDPILKQRIVDVINAQLQAKGFRQVNEGADLGVAAHMATQEQKTLNTFYDRFGGGWRWGGGFGSATTTVSTYEEGTLIVDLFDASTKQAIWRGTATEGISDNPEKQSKNIEKAAEKLFAKFPEA
jgi:hypothetical protein